ncbi:hypothetical protein NPIL_232841 [Nephila pilipes]|uniref:Uncharacterized protein n=1 Tax=Nephila pilipes TaxID=299642 RepID=A0A8X6PZX6_NEPPI|nr:hypothetical protein NPIL_232841 [Nephila pilipes]
MRVLFGLFGFFTLRREAILLARDDSPLGDNFLHHLNNENCKRKLEKEVRKRKRVDLTTSSRKKKSQLSTSEKHSPAVPENSTAVPENSTVIPEKSTSVREISTAIPENSTALPEK